VNNRIDNEDLRVFATAARKASFAAAAEELGMSPAYVSKRIGILEQALGVRLFHRTTRRVIVSEDGERVYAHAMTILENLDSLLHEVAERRDVPRGLLRISSSFGFGRNVVAPVVARLVAAHPSLQVRFEVFDRLVDIVAEGFDLDIRIGDDIAPHLIARKLMANQRILCASPAYLKQHGTPRSLAELAATTAWPSRSATCRLACGRCAAAAAAMRAVKGHRSLSSNHGEIALQWAVEGAASSCVRNGTRNRTCTVVNLQVLPQYTQSANVWAVYPQRLAGSAKVRVCVQFLEQQLRPGRRLAYGVALLSLKRMSWTCTI
jgi:LysR family transcriptional activator of dmlA